MAEMQGGARQGSPSATRPGTPEHEQETVAALRPPRAFAAWIALGVLVLVYALFLAHYFAPAISDPDANGYWAQGSLLAKTGETSFEPTSSVEYIGMHWLLAESGRYYSRYPPGLAVPIAVICKLFGEEASVALNPALALLALVGTFLLVRLVLNDWWALAAPLLLAVNSTFTRHALACDSHMAVTTLLVWGLYFLVRWGWEGRLWQAFVAGLLLGCIPTVRYPEALYALGIGAFLLWHFRERRRIWLHYAVAAGAALLPIVPLMVHNQLAFGAPWRTAYALTHEQTGFGWDYFRQHFVQYLRYAQSDGVGLFFALGIIGAFVMAAERRTRALAVLLALIAMPVMLLYMAYYWAPQFMAQGTLRFLLPTFPLYFLAGLWALRTFTERIPGRLRWGVIAAVLLVQTALGIFTMGTDCRMAKYQKETLSRAAAALTRNAEPDSVVMAHPQLLQHLDFLRRWRLADLTVAREHPFLDRDEMLYDDRPEPMQRGKRRAQTEKYDGLGPMDRERAVAKDVRDWGAGKSIYFVGTEADIKNMRGSYLHPDNFKIVARIPMPKAPPMRGPEGLMGAAGRPRQGPAQGGPPRPDGPQPPGGAGPPQGMGAPDGPGAPQGPNRNPGRFAGPGMPQGPAGGGMGGLMDFVRGGDELVIAKWTYSFRKPQWLPERRPLWNRGGP